MNFRPMTVADLEVSAELYTQVFSAAPWTEPWRPKTAYTRLSHFYHSPGFFGVLAEQDGCIVGLVLGNREPFYDGDIFYLREMCVEDSKQSQGVGKQLLEALEHILRSQGVARAYLTTEHALPAARFYERMGFALIGSMGFYAKALGA